MSQPEPVDWETYASARLLGRNRLLFEEHQEVVRDFLTYFARQDPTLHILDVGCAAGFFLMLLRELGFHQLRGMDISQTAVAEARAKGLDCWVGDLTDPDLASLEPPADLVLLMDVLEHLEDPEQALIQIRSKLLAPGGRVFLTVPVYDALGERWTRRRRGTTRLQQAQEHDPTHRHAFTPRCLISVLNTAGFDVLESQRLYAPLPRALPRSWRALLSACLPQWAKGRFLRVVARVAL